MNENLLNVGITNNVAKNNLNENIFTHYSLDEFAKKLRMEKYDINELRKIKNEASLNEKLRNKKKILATKIQGFIRGFLLRKKFKLYMYEITVIAFCLFFYITI